MSKKKSFTLKSNSSLLDEITGSTPIPELSELSDMTQAESVPEKVAPKPKKAQKKVVKKKTAPPKESQTEIDLPAPPPKKKETREYFATRLPTQQIARLREASHRYDSKIQDIAEAAVEEYLSRRGM